MVEQVRARVRDGQVAAGRNGVHHLGYQRVRVVGVGDDVQDGEQRDRDRTAEVEQLPGPVEVRGGVAQVGVDAGGGAVRVAGEQRAGV
jgi:hypothetical protein